ncbi:MAG: TetR/AcrR family transcriptional regulator [Longimicrobiales bacterium]|nr:TetR/AcrR family transcriptional regulator [Longimicrobiales bacterium]
MCDQRDKILTCACDLYLSDGLEGFSMRKLARQVGVTAPALYRHYENREHVLADVVREAYREFTAQLYRALEGRTPQERFYKAGEGYVDFALKNARWYEILFTAPEQLGMSELPDDIEAMGCAVHQFWVDRVRECQDAGILRPGDPLQISLTMWAHAHGLLTLYHNGHFRMDEATFRGLFERSGATMMAGVATEQFAAQLAEQFGARQPRATRA